MVCKGTVLFGIQDLQQGAGRISVIGDAQFIHFIQDHDRIGSAALLDAVHDPAGHGADIGPPVAADIRFIPDAAQADPDIFTLQGPGNTLADAGLAGTGRSHKKQDGTGLLAAQVHDRDLLDDPLPDLLQSEMIFFQDSLCFSQVNILRFFLFPGKTGQEIQIVIEHARLCTVTALLTEPVQDLVRFLAGGFVHARFFHFNFQTAQVRNIFRMHFVQLLLQILDLLADGRFLIHLLVALLLGCLRVIFDGGHLQILIEHLFHHVIAAGQRILRQQGIAFLVGIHQPGRHGRRDLSHIGPLGNIAPDGRPPLIVIRKADDSALHLLQVFPGRLPVQVIQIRSSGDGQVYAVVIVDHHVVNVDPVPGPDTDISFRADLFNLA